MFGDARFYVTPLNGIETRVYDAMDRLISVTHPTFSTNIRLYGTAGADTFDTVGANYEQGNGGADVFVYRVGRGALEINADANAATTTSVLQMGPGITASQISVTSDSSGNLYLTDGVSGDQVKLDNQLNNGYFGANEYGVATVNFADGTVWTRQQLLDLATTGTAANTLMHGTAAANVFDSKGLARYAQGRGGADTFIYKTGYGQLEIDADANAATTTAVLQMDAGISASQVSITKDSSGNLYLADGVSGDQIKLDRQLNSGYYGANEYGVATVNFADGTVWTRQQLATMAATGGSALSQSIVGTSGTDTLDSQGHYRYATGNGGADMFIYNSGYGQLEISEYNSGAVSTAVLQMGTGISASQISVTSNGNDVYITDGVIGDRIRLVNQLSNTSYGVAAVNFADGTSWTRQQLLTMATANTALTDNYTYDRLGERLKHTNSQLGSSVAETTDYDRQGRIVRQSDFDGYATTYGYSFDGAIATNGLGIYGGWTVTTINTAGLTATKKMDYFGRAVGGTDFGNHTVNLTFDSAGRLLQQTNDVGQNLQYTYFNTGLLATASDFVASSAQFPRNMVSTYGYDADGNRLTESYTGSYTLYDYDLGLYQVTTSYQNASVTYDALNRMLTFQDTGQNSAHPANIAYEYDANGNVRRVASSYKDLVTNNTTSQDYWYRYDTVNRFVTTQGKLLDALGNVTQTRGAAGNHINRGATGTEITYDAAGNRATAVSASDSESYKYTADGYLSAVYIGGALRVQDVRDAMGRVISHSEYGTDGKVVYSKTATYDAKSQVLSDQTSTVQSDGSTMVANTTYDYKADVGAGVYTGAYQGGQIIHSRTTNTKIANGGSTGQPTTDTVNSYVWWGQAAQSGITYKPDITQSATNTSTFAYDASGHLTTVNIQDGRPRTVSYVTDAAGQILSRVESSSASSNPAEYYYDFNGMRVGDIGNNGPSQTNYAAAIAQRTQAAQTGPFANGGAVSFADFDQSYDAINPFSQAEAGVSQTYTVQAGDTMQSIASAAWGDSNLWYLISEANGLFGAVSLQAGQSLIIPTKVSNYHNDASTFRVYDPNKALGNVQPTVPRSHHNGCGLLGMTAVLQSATRALEHAFIGNMSVCWYFCRKYQ